MFINFHAVCRVWRKRYGGVLFCFAVRKLNSCRTGTRLKGQIRLCLMLEHNGRSSGCMQMYSLRTIKILLHEVRVRNGVLRNPSSPTATLERNALFAICHCLKKPTHGEWPNQSTNLRHSQFCYVNSASLEKRGQYGKPRKHSLQEMQVKTQLFILIAAHGLSA
jgi:hypothetical protein